MLWDTACFLSAALIQATFRFGLILLKVPPDLDKILSFVLEAQAELIQSTAQLSAVHAFDQGKRCGGNEEKRHGLEADGGRLYDHDEGCRGLRSARCLSSCRSPFL